MPMLTSEGRRRVGFGLTAVVPILLWWLDRRPTPGGRLVRRTWRKLTHQLRWLRGRGKGLLYQLTLRRPDPDVADEVLADRVRAELGLMTAHLDLPRVHVSVQTHVVTLRGATSTPEEAREFERAAAGVSGVWGVESRLSTELPPGANRPSQGPGRSASPLVRALLDEVRSGGCPAERAPEALRRVLTEFLALLTSREQGRLLSHLPPDVVPLTLPPARPASSSHPAGRQGFVRRATHPDLTPEAQAETVVGGVLRLLREADPGEAERVAAMLPADLRSLWMPASTAASC